MFLGQSAVAIFKQFLSTNFYFSNVSLVSPRVVIASGASNGQYADRLGETRSLLQSRGLNQEELVHKVSA